MKDVVIAGKGALAEKIFRWYLKFDHEYHIVCFVPVVPADNDLDEWCSSKMENLANEHNIPYVKSGRLEDIEGIDRSDFNCDILQLKLHQFVHPIYN